MTITITNYECDDELRARDLRLDIRSPILEVRYSMSDVRAPLPDQATGRPQVMQKRAPGSSG